MTIHRCLDLEGISGNRVLAGIEQIPAKHAHAPVIPALNILLYDDPVESLINLRATRKNPAISLTFSTRSEKEVEGSFTISGDPSSSKRCVTSLQ